MIAIMHEALAGRRTKEFQILPVAISEIQSRDEGGGGGGGGLWQGQGGEGLKQFFWNLKWKSDSFTGLEVRGHRQF